MSNWLHDLINNDFVYVNEHTLDFDFNASNKENCFFEFHDLKKFVFDLVEKIVNEFKEKSH